MNKRQQSSITFLQAFYSLTVAPYKSVTYQERDILMFLHTNSIGPQFNTTIHSPGFDLVMFNLCYI